MLVAERMKTCRDCGTSKGISDFYVKERRKYATRYFSRCKPCYYKWVYAKDKAQGFKWHGRSERNWAARYKVMLAVASGKLIKPELCEECGFPTRPERLHGHHEDYARPLDVLWLCDLCHHKRHS